MSSEPWSLLLLSAALASAVALLLRHRLTSRSMLPSGPRSLPFLGHFLFFARRFEDLCPAIAGLAVEYGHAATLYVAGVPLVYIFDRGLAHRALVEMGAKFADRPPPLGGSRIYSSDGHIISSAPYGDLWRLLRRNLTSGVLHPARFMSFSWARERALASLVGSLRSEAAAASGNGSVVVYDHIQGAFYHLLSLLCFGDAISPEKVEEIIASQRDNFSFASKLILMDIWPRAAKVFQWRTWKKFLASRRKQEAIMSHLIRARRARRKERGGEGVLCYLDTLLDLELPDEGRRMLTDDELVSLCSEFLNAGTESTTTTLEWILAELVRQPEVQRKLRQEIGELAAAAAAAAAEGTGRAQGRRVVEGDLEKAAYLKAVVMEGLRRHPPAHLLLPHTAREDTQLGEYVIPKGAMVNFTLAEMARDERVWERAMDFRPERFAAGGEGEGVDLTCSREIRMAPFGAGRRICPGMGLAVLHLEYFLANLVAEFEWRPAAEGEEVDMAEKLVFTVVMKHPLRARISTPVN